MHIKTSDDFITHRESNKPNKKKLYNYYRSTPRPNKVYYIKYILYMVLENIPVPGNGSGF